MEHCGESCGFGDTEQVSATELLKPPTAVRSMVEVADCPGFTVPGDKAEAETAKSGVSPKVAVSVTSELIVTTHSSWVCGQFGSLQPLNVEPGFAKAAMWIVVPLG
jgi:hypothetical protein